MDVSAVITNITTNEKSKKMAHHSGAHGGVGDGDFAAVLSAAGVR